MHDNGIAIPHCPYLIVGASHAGLSALDAIRLNDEENAVTIITKEETLPYSPTILPYFISGQTSLEQIFLRDDKVLKNIGVHFVKGAEVTAVNPVAYTVSLSSGKTMKYDKLLLATGATPALPAIDGLNEVPYYVLRTLQDALRLKDAEPIARSVAILGAGLIGMHAAESLAQKGMIVKMIEIQAQVLPGYFDEEAASLIQQVFMEKGIAINTASKVEKVSRTNGGVFLNLESGQQISADLLLITTGVQPCIDYLNGSGIETDKGILVNETMRTNLDRIWAAGDVVQAPRFFDSENALNTNLPNAVEQGRIAGMDMSSDPALKPYPGGIRQNTYKFFNHRAFTVGVISWQDLQEGIQVDRIFLPERMRYQKLVFQNRRLIGAVGINTDMDPGVIVELIRRKIDLSGVKTRFSDLPLETGRILMTQLWR